MNMHCGSSCRCIHLTDENDSCVKQSHRSFLFLCCPLARRMYSASLPRLKSSLCHQAGAVVQRARTENLAGGKPFACIHQVIASDIVVMAKVFPLCTNVCLSSALSQRMLRVPLAWFLHVHWAVECGSNVWRAGTARCRYVASTGFQA